MYLNPEAILGIVKPSNLRPSSQVPAKKIKDDDVAKISVGSQHQADIPDMLGSQEEMEVDKQLTTQDSKVWCADEKGVKSSIAQAIVTEMNTARYRSQLPAGLTLQTRLPNARSGGTRLATIMRYDEDSGTYRVYDGDDEYNVNVEDFVLSTPMYYELVCEAVHQSSQGIDLDSLVNLDLNKIHLEAVNSFIQGHGIVHELSEIQAAEINSMFPQGKERCRPWTTDEVVLLCNALDKYKTDIRSAWKILMKQRNAPKRTIKEVIDFCYKNFPTGMTKEKLDRLKKIFIAKSGERPDAKDLEESRDDLNKSYKEEDADDRELKEAIAEEIEADRHSFGVREIRIDWNKAWTTLTKQVKWRDVSAGQKIKQKLEELGVTEADELLLCTRAQLNELSVHLKDIPKMSFHIAMNVQKVGSNAAM